LNLQLNKLSRLFLIISAYASLVYIFIWGSSFQIITAILLNLFSFWVSGTHLSPIADQKNNRSINNRLIVIIDFGEGCDDNHYKDSMNPNFGNAQWNPG